MPLIDRKALATELGLSPRTIEKWSTRAGFPVHRLGGARRYSIAEVLAWAQRGGGSTARGATTGKLLAPPPTVEDDVAAVERLAKQAIAAGYPAEAVELRQLTARVGASSSIVSSLAIRIRAILGRSAGG